MQPTPQTLEALQMFEDQGDDTVTLTLDVFAFRAGEIVPDLVGLSFVLLDPVLTFTMTSPNLATTDVRRQAVGSSLAFPLTHANGVIGGISLYAASAGAFVGRQGSLAEVLGTDVTAAVADQDLCFWSRLKAGSAVRQIQDSDVIDQATGFIASASDTELDAAHRLLRESADQAGISEVAIAKAVLGRQLDVPRTGTTQYE